MTEWVSFEELADEGRNGLKSYWLSFLEESEFMEKANLCQFRLEWVPMEEAKRKCMEETPDLQDSYPSFESYHQQYLKGEEPVDHGDSVWACLYDGDDEWLLDGWHRFHSYVRKGLAFIPVLYIR